MKIGGIPNGPAPNGPANGNGPNAPGTGPKAGIGGTGGKPNGAARGGMPGTGSCLLEREWLRASSNCVAFEWLKNDTIFPQNPASFDFVLFLSSYYWKKTNNIFNRLFIRFINRILPFFCGIVPHTIAPAQNANMNTFIFKIHVYCYRNF